VFISRARIIVTDTWGFKELIARQNWVQGCQMKWGKKSPKSSDLGNRLQHIAKYNRTLNFPLSSMTQFGSLVDDGQTT
jgi:hypothetical protein